MYDSGLLPVYKAGFISLDKQYLTIGLNGLNQAAEFLGIECNNNEDYMNFFKEHPDYNNGSWGFEETWTFAQYCYKLGLKAQ
jgi:hypothetical protein